MIRFALAALFLVLAVPTQAQEADPADVESIDAIIAAVYDVISGPSDVERDWDRFRTMFHPEGRLIPTGPSPNGGWGARVMTVEEYVELAGNQFRNAPIFQGKGFYEVEASQRVERYGNIAHVWSTYESRLDPAEEPFQRGINTFQLMHNGTGWQVMSILWQAESDDAPIPAPYLPEGE